MKLRSESEENPIQPPPNTFSMTFGCAPNDGVLAEIAIGVALHFKKHLDKRMVVLVNAPMYRVLQKGLSEFVVRKR
jgi:hypothetical protein